MYKIVKDTTILGYAESPNYVTKAENDSYILVSETEATGISYNGVVYNIEGKNGSKELETIKLVKIDGGELLNEQTAQLRADVDFIAAMGGIEL